MVAQSKLSDFPCDRCGTLSVCRFEYLDPDQHNLPMLFCSLECLSRYVLASAEASLGYLQGGSGIRSN